METINKYLHEKKTQYRWVVCVMLFGAITINYLDRQVLSLTWPKYIGPEFGWTNDNYGSITAWFSLFYAVSMLFIGHCIDWLGTKKGFLLAVGIWSIGAFLHAFCAVITLGEVGGEWFVSFDKTRDIIAVLKKSNAESIISISVTLFLCARLVLAFGEAGNFPSAIKATAEYFPKKDRAFSTSIFNSGATIGAMIAPAVILYISSIWGWEMAFIIIGFLGFIWMGFWIFLYKKPEVNPRVNRAELEYIRQDKYSEDIVETMQEAQLSFLRCFQFKQTWAFAVGKFMTDGVWWFYLFWIPKYLQTVFGLEGKAQIFPLTILYMVVMLSIVGGWLPTFFIEKKGMNPYAGRMKAMLIFAFIPLVALFVQPLGTYTYWLPVILIGVAGAAHQAWSANIFSITGDMFPRKAIATITGIGGMAGGIGSFFIQKTAGKLFDYASNNQIIFGGFKGESAGYFIIFCTCAIAYLISWVIMKILVPVYKPIIG
ncbi:MAG: MFS transporter [Candidatus Azobacteroides pseudotrichonymphae]|uniref:Hexuronate transporter n=1 Tax=Azobacteroides pseudotrichonymphae genomovar. CFP2 TaxID=511995 RepID=B6YRT7_AZOPC|nr:hexuronate transporter [Candidatus Azobacteroides pseudotrichonymphae genomovar. CFP2]GMO33163.1 MAG: MFS transporter [Candidatus Azobacteroides pseudotrichonymphae]